MKDLSNAEAGTVATLLGAREESEGELYLRAGLSRSTYQDARRRAYARGWLDDRYVPNPSSFGFGRAVFFLGEPFLDQLPSAAQAWREEAGAVVAWSSPQLFFGVALARDLRRAQAILTKLGSASHFRGSTSVLADLEEPTSVPVYFDFEGAWVRFVGGEGTHAYPRPLVGRSPPAEPFTPSTLHAAEELVRRPTEASREGSPWRKVGPFWLPRTQRRLAEEGHLNHRVLLHPGAIEEFQGRQIDQVVFVSGECKESSTAPALLRALNRAGSFPWLLAEGEGSVLLGVAGQRRPPKAGPAPVPIHTTLGGVLAEYLQSLKIVRESFDAFNIVLSHRYDRLFRAP